MKRMRAIALLLALTLMLVPVLTACGDDGSDQGGTEATTGIPTEPPTEEPSEAPTEEPTEEPTEPADSASDAEPEETMSEDTEPEGTMPEETMPEETMPEETMPEDTTPEDTAPEDTEPEDTAPEDTTPEDTAPKDTAPENTEPEDTAPEDTEPEEPLEWVTVDETVYTFLPTSLSREVGGEEIAPLDAALALRRTHVAEGWSRVEAMLDGVLYVGYVPSAHLTTVNVSGSDMQSIPGGGKVMYAAADGLTVRRYPTANSTVSPVIGTLSRGEEIVVVAQNARWARIACVDAEGTVTYGYVSTLNLSELPPSEGTAYEQFFISCEETVRYTTEHVSFRLSPVSSEDNLIDRLPAGTEITVTRVGTVDGCAWCYGAVMIPSGAEGETAVVRYGYVVAEFLSDTSPEDTAPEDTDPADPEDTDPADPEDTDPADPEDTDPAEPEDTDPTEPEDTTSPEPEDTDPTEPEDTTPTEPEDTDPTEPEDTTSPEPEDTDPTEPEDTDPAEPEDTTPTEPPVLDDDPTVEDPDWETVEPEDTDPSGSEDTASGSETTDNGGTQPDVVDIDGSVTRAVIPQSNRDLALPKARAVRFSSR